MLRSTRWQMNKLRLAVSFGMAVSPGRRGVKSSGNQGLLRSWVSQERKLSNLGHVICSLTTLPGYLRPLIQTTRASKIGTAHHFLCLRKHH